MALPLPSTFGGATMAKILLRSGIPESRRNGPPTSDIRIHFGRAYLAGRREEGAFGRRSLLNRGMFTLQWYGWPQLPATARAREFLISRAGWLLLRPLGGTAVHFASCDGEDAGESTLLQQSLKSDFFRPNRRFTS